MLTVLVQYRMATTEQRHWVAPGVQIEQARRRLAHPGTGDRQPHYAALPVGGHASISDQPVPPDR
ncbi:hypothetical protein [Streptomyces sp. NBC_01451]|uniref:hypothetical protein n=1 Tax=Streptomyces sp. NBC_01451 TaxID=2903872 RepID=UPI002E3538D0|nr:hypothetical protein [Streptomyces sp. NBC_01451]